MHHWYNRIINKIAKFAKNINVEKAGAGLPQDHNNYKPIQLIPLNDNKPDRF